MVLFIKLQIQSFNQEQLYCVRMSVTLLLCAKTHANIMCQLSSYTPVGTNLSLNR